MKAVCDQNHKEIARLLGLGANPNVMLWDYYFSNTEIALIHKALFLGDLKTVDLLLAHRATDPRGKLIRYGKDEDGEKVVEFEITLLDQAASSEGLDDLVERLAPLTASERMNKPATHLALAASCQHKNPEITACLLLNGASININQINSETGKTALHEACHVSVWPTAKNGDLLYPKVDQLKYLLFFGANTKIEDDSGHTARQFIEGRLRAEVNRPYWMKERPDITASCDEFIKVFDAFDKKDPRDGGEFDTMYQETAGKLAARALKSSARGNVFKQLQRRQHGVSKSMNKEMEHRRRELTDPAKDEEA